MNIFNVLTLIGGLCLFLFGMNIMGDALGLSSLITSLTVAKSTIKVEIPFMIAVTLLLLGIGYNGTIGFWEGILLLVVFVIYLGYLLYMAKRDRADDNEEIKEISISKALIWTVVVFFS